MNVVSMARLAAASALALGATAVAPSVAYADSCNPSTEAAVSTRVDVETLKQGTNQPRNSKFTFKVAEGQSFTWSGSNSVGAVAGRGGSNLSVSRTTSNEVTYSMDVE